MDRFQPERRIAKGATAEVFEATEPDTGARVAVKVAHQADAGTRDAFQTEAEILRRLGGTKNIGLVAAAERDGRPYLVLELADGPSLAAVLEMLSKRGTSLAPELTARVVSDVLVALVDVHAAGLVHADVNPRNVVVDRTGRARLVDFGSCGPPRLTEGGVIGSLAYAAPELILTRRIDTACDLWSVGVLAWECLHGRRLFRAETWSRTLSMVVERPLPETTVGEPWSTLVGQILHRGPRPSAASALGPWCDAAASREALAQLVSDLSK